MFWIKLLTIIRINLKQKISIIYFSFQSEPFWILTKAVRDFVENEGNGCLPLRGSLPDMTANTYSYITLQQM